MGVIKKKNKLTSPRWAMSSFGCSPEQTAWCSRSSRLIVSLWFRIVYGRAGHRWLSAKPCNWNVALTNCCRGTPVTAALHPRVKQCTLWELLFKGLCFFNCQVHSQTHLTYVSGLIVGWFCFCLKKDLLKMSLWFYTGNKAHSLLL